MAFQVLLKMMINYYEGENMSPVCINSEDGLYQKVTLPKVHFSQSAIDADIVSMDGNTIPH